MRKITLLFAVFLSLLGVTQVKAESKTANFNSGLPDGWSIVGDLTNDNTRARSGNGIWTSSKSTSDNYLITEPVEGTFEFYARAYNKSYASTVVVYEYTGSGLGTQLYTTGSMYTATTPAWSKFSFTLPSGGRVAIVLNYAAIDDVTYTEFVEGSCKQPLNFAATNITANSADLSWNKGDEEQTQWQIVYSTDSEFDKDAATPINVNSTSYTLTGLNDNTTYYVAVRSYCSVEEQSAWVSSSFKTLRAPIASYPWSENFNGLTSGIPDGWDNTEGTTTYDSYKWNYSSSGHDGGCVMFNSSYNTDGNTNFLKTPVMVFSQNAPMQLKFWYKNPTGGDFSVFISNDGGATYTQTLATGLTGASSWTEKTIDLPTDVYYSNVVIVFKATSNYGDTNAYIYLDDVVIKEAVNYSMSISGKDVSENTIAFGTVRNTTTTKTFTISNEGTQSLTGITVVSSDVSVFTVSDTGFDLAANEKKDITVTFVKGVVGDYDETITISQANVSNQVLNVTGTYTDTWEEDFEGGVVPEGWTANGWTVTNSNWDNNGTYMLAAGSSTNTMYSPRLYAVKDQQLTFYVGGADNTDYQTVKWANSRNAAEEDWTLIGEFTTKGNQTFTAPATGYYYLSFQGKYTSVDNFEGFKYAPLEHDAMITAQSIPATGNEGVEYTATVTVKEMAGKAEELTAKFFIGSTQYGDDVVETVDANGTKTFTVTFTPAGAISGDAHFTVTNSNIDLTSDNVAVAIAAAPVLDEAVGSLAGFENMGSYPVLKLTYSLKAGWNTIILPFAVNDLSVFGANAKAYDFTNYSESALVFSKVTSLVAQTPYVIYSDEAKSTITFTGVTGFRNSEDAADLRTTKNGVTFQGTYAPIAAGNWPDGAYGVTTAGKIAPGSTATSFMKGFRAYLTGVTADARLSFEDDATGITTIIDAKELNNDGKVFNLNGQQVKSAHKGLYIVNGRKVVVK